MLVFIGKRQKQETGAAARCCKRIAAITRCQPVMAADLSTGISVGMCVDVCLVRYLRYLPRRAKKDGRLLFVAQNLPICPFPVHDAQLSIQFCASWQLILTETKEKAVISSCKRNVRGFLRYEVCYHSLVSLQVQDRQDGCQCRHFHMHNCR